MNYEEKNKSGFKTFIVTLSISLIVFSSVYYLMNADASSVKDIEAETETPITQSTPKSVAGTQATNTSAFGTLANSPKVLAGADSTETTESSVPATGSETLAGTLISLTAFGFATYYFVIGPRKLALASFEKKITND